MNIQINNAELKKAFSDSTKTQLLEQVQVVDNSKVIPIVDVTPRKFKNTDIVRRNVCQNATSTTLYTTPSNADFYLTGVSLNVIKDATSQSVSSRVNIIINGATQTILSIEGLSLTAQIESNTISVIRPVKVDRGTNITLTNTNATANITAGATICGYVDNVM